MYTHVYAGSETFSKKDNPKSPVYITSNEMISENNGDRITFAGNVVTKRDTMTIHSDKLEVYNNDNNNKKIIAIGNVTIDRDGKYAEGEKAIYFEEKKWIELLGNVKAWEDENVITGERMIFFIDDDKVQVFGNKVKRVNMTFYPKEDKENDNKNVE